MGVEIEESRRKRYMSIGEGGDRSEKESEEG